MPSGVLGPQAAYPNHRTPECPHLRVAGKLFILQLWVGGRCSVPWWRARGNGQSQHLEGSGQLGAGFLPVSTQGNTRAQAHFPIPGCSRLSESSPEG